MMKLFAVFFAAALASFSLGGAQAQSPGAGYPAKPVMMITPAAAGNSPDVLGRIVADKLAQLWKQQVLVVNRPGAGGLIAAQAASTADPDGYTLYMTQASTFTVLPMMHDKLPFDLQRDFKPIALVGEQPIAVVVPPSLGVNTLPELMELTRKTKGGLLFAASNRGGQSHLTGELFRKRTGLELTFVHAAGAASSVNDVSQGRIPLMFEAIAAVGGAVQGGSLKLLAVASAKRLPNYPDLPTIGEFIPGFESKGWLALMAPAGTPDAIVQKVSDDVKTVMAMPNIIARFEAIGAYARHLPPAELTAFIKAEQDLWWPVVREVNEKK
jgi:tripartite-type tricarboxylate transporter receptor subunit TctC